MAKRKKEGIAPPPPPPPPKQKLEDDFARVVSGQQAAEDQVAKLTEENRLLREELAAERRRREEAEESVRVRAAQAEGIIADHEEEIVSLKRERDKLLRKVEELEELPEQMRAEFAERAKDYEARIKELEDEVMFDDLTGLRRRKNLTFEANLLLDRVMEDQKRLAAGVSERREGTEPQPKGPDDFSVILLDLDDFSQVNNLHGHAAGDEVLRTVARTIMATVRPKEDLVGRWGGEEMIICIRNSRGGGVVLAERIRRALEGIDIRKNKYRIPVTASIGVAKWEKGEVLDDVIAHADEAQYRAKAAGKNRVWPYKGVEGVEGPLAAPGAEPPPKKQSGYGEPEAS